MKKVFYITLLFSVFCFGVTKAQDSLFFYKSGDIIYKEAGSMIDSVAFVAPDYYEINRSNIVFDDLKSNSELTRFAQMIQIAGYVKKLDNTTIWAPINSALSQINLSDTALVRQIVTNHIAKSKISTAQIGDSQKIIMLNNKRLFFTKSLNNYFFDGNAVLTSNIYSFNSIIHIINGYAPFKPNIWDYITQGTGHDLMKAYVNAHTNKTFDSPTGNTILDQLPFANNEDSLYSAIIPSDEAWTDAYTKLYPYCVVPDDSLSNSHDEATKFAIIHNNFFKGKLNAVTTDSVFTATSGYKLKSPATILAGAQTNELTNGNCFNVNQLKMYNPEYRNNEIRIEAENTGYGLKTQYYSSTITTYTDGVFNISDKKYLKLTPSSSLNTAYVEFPIPNTLATKYNVYCVFVPGTAVNPNDHKPYKVRFSLSYLDNKNATGTAIPTGYQVTRATVDANNNIQAPSVASNIFITDGATVQKMLVVKNLQLPFCNLYMSNISPIKFSLFVENAVGSTASELVNYSKTPRIDCIILEPVQ